MPRCCCPTKLIDQTVCASTLIYVCTAVLSVLGSAAIAFFYAELNSVSSLSRQPLEAISYLLGNAVSNEIDDVVYNMAAATRLFAAKIVISSEQFLNHDSNETLRFLEILMRNDTFSEIHQINYVSGDETSFTSLQETPEVDGRTLYASIVRNGSHCREDFFYPSMQPYPAVGNNTDCDFNFTNQTWYVQGQSTNAGELYWGMDLNGPSLAELAQLGMLSTAQTYSALSISDDGRALGSISAVSFAPAVVTQLIDSVIGSLVQTSSAELLADTVLCVAHRSTETLLVADVNNSDLSSAVEQCNNTMTFVKDHFGGSLNAVVSDMWIDERDQVISTHTPTLPVRLGQSGHIDWVLWVCDDAEHLQTEQRNSIVVTLAIAAVGIIVVGVMMYSRLNVVLNSPATLRSKTLVQLLHDVNYRTHEVYVLVVVVVLIWWQVSNNRVIVEYAQIILEVSSVNTVREVSHMLSKPFILNNVIAEELPRILTPNNMMTCKQENTGAVCADQFFYDSFQFDTCTSEFAEMHGAQFWCQSDTYDESSWDSCNCSTPTVPATVYDNWLIENVFAFTVFAQPIFSVGFGTSQGVYEEAMASINETYMAQFSDLQMYPSSMLTVCNVPDADGSERAAGDFCLTSFGSPFRGWGTQKGICRPLLEFIPDGLSDTLVCVPTAVTNATDDGNAGDDGDGDAWSTDARRRLEERQGKQEYAFDELFSSSAALVLEGEPAAAVVVDGGVGATGATGAGAAGAAGAAGVLRQRQPRSLLHQSRNLAAATNESAQACNVCGGHTLGDSCSFVRFGVERFGYCGQYTANEEKVCCLPYAVPEIAVAACNFDTENTTCRYFSEVLDMTIQGFCRSMTPLMPMMPSSILYVCSGVAVFVHGVACLLTPCMHACILRRTLWCVVMLLS